jgi:hypothetical protein
LNSLALCYVAFIFEDGAAAGALAKDKAGRQIWPLKAVAMPTIAVLIT